MNGNVLLDANISARHSISAMVFFKLSQNPRFGVLGLLKVVSKKCIHAFP